MSNAVTTVPAHQVSDMERMAKAFAASKLFGVQNADQALALMLVAQAEGRHPASAAQDYNIIQGRPAKKADAMLRDFLSAGGKVEWHTLNDEKADATFSHPAGGSARIDWTLKRAQAAGISNPMWKKYPRQMLRSRAVSEGVRTVCPGATSGMYVPEEVQDIVHVEPAPVRVEAVTVEPAIEGDFTAGPQRKSSAQAKRDGDHERIMAEVDRLTKDGLADWLANFDRYTSDLPLSWLDPIRDRLHLRRDELFGKAQPEDDMDAAFAGAVGRAA